MDTNQLHKEFNILNDLLENYSQYNIIKFDKSKNIFDEYNINNLVTLINICFIDDTYYLEHKIKDMLFFLNELIELEKNIKDDYDRYTRLKFLYEDEYKKLKHHLKIYSNSTKEDIRHNIIHELEEYFNHYTIKEFEFIKGLISSFRDYHNEITIANIIKKASPNDKNFNSLKKSMINLIEYATYTKDNELERNIKYRYDNIKNIEVTRANRKILTKFDNKLIFLISSYFSDKVIKNNNEYRFENLTQIFKKAKPNSIKFSNKLKDSLLITFKKIKIKYIF